MVTFKPCMCFAVSETKFCRKQKGAKNLDTLDFGPNLERPILLNDALC